MRFFIYPFVLLFMGGCFSTQEPHNPMDRSSTAPVESSAPADETPEVPEAPSLAPTSRVEMIKEMFTLRLELQSQILQTAEGLTPEELKEINAWLAQHGVELRKSGKCTNPDHDHGSDEDSDQSREVF